MLDNEALNERIRLYYKKGQKDLDEFDNIILQLSMQVMQTGDINMVQENAERFEEIREQFLRRVARKEFPVVKYIVYLQFGALLGGDQELLDNLIRYGFDILYPKLRWLEKVSSLEIASSLKPPYAQKLLDKVACDILLTEYEELASQMQTTTIIQLMGVYYQTKY